MTKTPTPDEFAEELALLREDLLLMAGRVEEMIHRSGRALVQRDVPFAKETIELDREVNKAELDIDERCLAILARRHPVSSDLRFVTLALKMVTDLERIADLAVNICERAIDLSSAAPVVVHADIPRMTELVESMVKDAIDAFVQNDSEKARSVLVRDDDMDELYRRVFEDTLERMRVDSEQVHQLIHVQSVAKWLERMGDHSTNLAEMVIFMIDGRDVRHATIRTSSLPKE